MREIGTSLSIDRTVPENWVSPGALPLEVDFGCHCGEFLINMATMFPLKNFLGIERQRSRVDRCHARIQRAGLTNVIAIHQDGAETLNDLLPAASVTILYVSFPDPWPKRRHARRRLVNRDFLTHVARVLGPKGTLRLMTDDVNYFSEMQKLAADSWVEVAWNDGVERQKTTFEKRFYGLGTPPCQLAIQSMGNTI